MSTQDLLLSTQQICDAIKHCRVLGLKAVDAGPGRLTLELPYSAAIVGNPETGVIHGGALTTLMDSACGFAEPNRSVFGAAEVYRITRHVVFVRGVAYQTTPAEPVAHCVATFMRISEPRLPNLDGAIPQ